MNDTQFQQLADQFFLHVAEILDAHEGEASIDYDNNDNVMTLLFENGSKIVINRQEPLHQIWLATPMGGYHFDYQDTVWRCNRSGEELFSVLAAACTKLAGEPVNFS